MIKKIFDKLPWRVQSLIGYRPRKTITDIAEINPKFIKKGEYSLDFDDISLPVNCEKTLPTAFHTVNKEKTLKNCSSFYTLELKNAAYLNVEGYDTIIKNGKIIEPLSYRVDYLGLTEKTHPALTIFKYPKCKYLKGKTLALSTIGASTTYGHWIIDLLPRIGYAQKLGYTLDEFDHILLNKISFPYQKELINLFQIPESKIIQTDINDYYKCETLIIPSYTPHSMYGFKFLKHKLIDQVEIQENSTKKRIYLSRKKNKWMRVINENDILPILLKHNFEIIEFENTPILEQIELMRNTEFLISPQGSGLTNVIYMNPKSKVIEIYNESYINTTFWGYAIYNKLVYGALMASPVPIEGSNAMDIYVDPSKLEKLIKKMDSNN